MSVRWKRRFGHSRRYSARAGIRSRRQRRRAARLTAAGAVLVCVIAGYSWWAAADHGRTALAVAREADAADADLAFSDPVRDVGGGSVLRLLERVRDYGDTDPVIANWFTPDARVLVLAASDEPIPTLPWTDADLEHPLAVREPVASVRAGDSSPPMR